MIANKYIKIKAAFLVIVFSTNIIIGFACSVGINMGFNSTHHYDEEANETAMHVHGNGKKHIHHNEPTEHHDKDGKDNCCHDKVTEIAQFDKSVPPSFSVINPIFYITFVSTFCNCEILFSSQVTPSVKYFVQNYHPPIPDIRIAIQSFLI